MDAGYCLYVHIFMKNIKSLKPFNFYNSNQRILIIMQNSMPIGGTVAEIMSPDKKKQTLQTKYPQKCYTLALAG